MTPLLIMLAGSIGRKRRRRSIDFRGAVDGWVNFWRIWRLTRSRGSPGHAPCEVMEHDPRRQCSAPAPITA